MNVLKKNNCPACKQPLSGHTAGQKKKCGDVMSKWAVDTPIKKRVVYPDWRENK